MQPCSGVVRRALTVADELMGMHELAPQSPVDDEYSSQSSKQRPLALLAAVFGSATHVFSGGAAVTRVSST